ncbi:MAG TPA: tetratricopeptide repeat protein [Rubellimicrobium sp.]|nr:tetratricopeptide repeat protein [Rubellimicrobium sp.]
MANTNDSFIDEVAEAVRRERLNLWFRRWGWVLGLLVLLIVGIAAWTEWRQSREQSAAEARGEAILSAVEAQSAEDRLAGLSALPRAGDEGVVAALLLGAEQSQNGDAPAAAETMNAVASDGSVPPLYRDLAALKAQMALGSNADRAALEALAAPGAPFRLLAQEQIALLDLAQDDRDGAIATLQDIRQDAEVSAATRGRVEALLTALGVALDDVPEGEAPAPVEE